MTAIHDSSQIVLTLAGAFGAGVGATWLFMRAIGAGRDALRGEILDAIADLKREIKADIGLLWKHNRELTDKWEAKADKVHERLFEHDRNVRNLSDRVLEIGVLLASGMGRGNGRSRVPRQRAD